MITNTRILIVMSNCQEIYISSSRLIFKKSLRGIFVVVQNLNFHLATKREIYFNFSIPPCNEHRVC